MVFQESQVPFSLLQKRCVPPAGQCQKFHGQMPGDYKVYDQIEKERQQLSFLFLQTYSLGPWESIQVPRETPRSSG